VVWQYNKKLKTSAQLSISYDILRGKSKEVYILATVEIRHSNSVAILNLFEAMTVKVVREDGESGHLRLASEASTVREHLDVAAIRRHISKEEDYCQGPAMGPQDTPLFLLEPKPLCYVFESDEEQSKKAC
jgi:hypothetical protein